MSSSNKIGNTLAPNTTINVTSVNEKSQSSMAKAILAARQKSDDNVIVSSQSAPLNTLLKKKTKARTKHQPVSKKLDRKEQQRIHDEVMQQVDEKRAKAYKHAYARRLQHLAMAGYDNLMIDPANATTLYSDELPALATAEVSATPSSMMSFSQTWPPEQPQFSQSAEQSRTSDFAVDFATGSVPFGPRDKLVPAIDENLKAHAAPQSKTMELIAYNPEFSDAASSGATEIALPMFPSCILSFHEAPNDWLCANSLRFNNLMTSLSAPPMVDASSSECSADTNMEADISFTTCEGVPDDIPEQLMLSGIKDVEVYGSTHYDSDAPYICGEDAPHNFTETEPTEKATMVTLSTSPGISAEEESVKAPASPCLLLSLPEKMEPNYPRLTQNQLDELRKKFIIPARESDLWPKLYVVNKRPRKAKTSNKVTIIEKKEVVDVIECADADIDEQHSAGIARKLGADDIELSGDKSSLREGCPHIDAVEAVQYNSAHNYSAVSNVTKVKQALITTTIPAQIRGDDLQRRLSGQTTFTITPSFKESMLDSFLQILKGPCPLSSIRPPYSKLLSITNAADIRYNPDHTNKLMQEPSKALILHPSNSFTATNTQLGSSMSVFPARIFTEASIQSQCDRHGDEEEVESCSSNTESVSSTTSQTEAPIISTSPLCESSSIVLAQSEVEDECSSLVGTTSLSDMMAILECDEEGNTDKGKVLEAFNTLAVEPQESTSSCSGLGTKQIDRIGYITLDQFLGFIHFDGHDGTTDNDVANAFLEAARVEAMAAAQKKARVEAFKKRRIARKVADLKALAGSDAGH